MSGEFGQQVSRTTIDDLFLSGPGEDLVPKLIAQLASVKGFSQLFGPFTPGATATANQSQNQRWADYPRFDWSIRELPAINVYESQTEDKDSDQAFLRGAITIQTFWPASFRRSDLARVPAAYKGALENFFSSKYVQQMLDELYWIQRPMKVYGLNELGKMMTWSPNVEGVIAEQIVPVTMVDVRYRIDLRAWHRALEFMGRTKGDPFDVTLANLTLIAGQYAGVTDPAGKNVEVEVQDQITVESP